MEQSGALKRGLEQIDASLGFLLIIILSVLLSDWSTRIQRGQLRYLLGGGNAAQCPSVFPIRYSASALIVGALGFFLSLSLDVLRQARAGNDPVALRSAQANALASVLVLTAALLRFDDLLFVERSRQTALLDTQDLPA